MQKQSSLPIWLSAFGFPGLGQLVQKRWIPGALYSTLFLSGFFWIMTLAVTNIIQLYSMAFDESMTEPQPYPITTFIPPLLLIAGIYLASLFDVFTAHHRQQSLLREKEFITHLESNRPN